MIFIIIGIIDIITATIRLTSNRAKFIDYILYAVGIILVTDGILRGV